MGITGGIWKLINKKCFDILTVCAFFPAWCLRNEGVSSVLLGSSTPEQLIENLGAIQASATTLPTKLQGISWSSEDVPSQCPISLHLYPSLCHSFPQAFLDGGGENVSAGGEGRTFPVRGPRGVLL